MKIKNIIESEKINLRILTHKDQPLLLKSLTNKTILEFWEGKNAVFDLNRIKKDFYSLEQQITRTIIEYQGLPIGYCQMYIVDKQTAKEYLYKLNIDQSRDKCMISLVISACTVTCSVYIQRRDQCMISHVINACTVT